MNVSPRFAKNIRFIMINSELLERAEDYFKRNFVKNSKGELPLGAKPLPITDAERAKTLETHRNYFANCLFALMEEKNLSEVEIAAKIHIDAAFFSRFLDDRRFIPKERTVWALVIALGLNLYEANSLMNRLQYYLDAKIREEVLLAFCLENRINDVDLVNELFKHYGFAPLEVDEELFTPENIKNLNEKGLIDRLELYIEEIFCEPPTETSGIKFSYSASALGEPAESVKTFDVIVRKLKNAVGMSGNLFSDYLLTLIKQKNLTEVEVYKRAHLDRRIFSKIRNEKAYMPAKKTVLAIAFAMKLDFKETNTLLARAGYWLSTSRKEDVIAAYFVENQIYDLFLINEVLNYYDCPTLGD